MIRVLTVILTVALAASGARAAGPRIALTPEVGLRMTGLLKDFPSDRALIPAALDGLALAHPTLADPSLKAASELLIQGVTVGLPEAALNRLPPELSRLTLELKRAAREDVRVARALNRLHAEVTSGRLEVRPPDLEAPAAPAPAVKRLEGVARGNAAAAAAAFDQGAAARGSAPDVGEGRRLADLGERLAASRLKLDRLRGALDPDQEGAVRLAEALRAGDWSAPVIAHERALYFAKAAREKGLITEGQYVTMFLRWEAFELYRLEPENRSVVPALDVSGRLTPFARGLLGNISPEALLPRPVSPEEAGLPMIRRFEAAIKRLPSSERTIFLLTKPGDGGVKAVPSFGLLQASLEGLFGEDAVRLIPHDRELTRDEVLAETAGGGRVLGYSTPWGRRQIMVGGTNLGMYRFTLHDFGHAYAGSGVPAAIRKLGPRLARVLEDYANETPVSVDGVALKPLSKKFIEDYKDIFADLDHVASFGNRWTGLGSGLLSLERDAALIIARDMALHPEAWRPFDVRKEAEVMGGDFKKVFEYFRSGGKGRPLAGETLSSTEEPESPRGGRSDARGAGLVRLLKALDAGDWRDLTDKKALHDAKAAREKGLITEGPYVTLFLLWEALEDLKSNKPVVRSFPAVARNGRLTVEAKRLAGTYRPELNTDAALDPAVVKRFETMVKALPLSERRLWTITSRHENVVLATIVPSFGMLQASLDAAFGKDAVRLRPSERSMSRRRIIEQSARGERVLGFSVPWLKPQDNVDGDEIGLLQFTMHDFRHAYEASSIPVSLRRASARVASILEHFKTSARRSEPPIKNRMRGEDVQIGNAVVKDILDGVSDGTLFFREKRSRAGVGRALVAAVSPLHDREDVLYLVVRDMALNPEAWSEFDIPKEVSAIDAAVLSQWGWRAGYSSLYKDLRAAAAQGARRRGKAL